MCPYIYIYIHVYIYIWIIGVIWILACNPLHPTTGYTDHCVPSIAPTAIVVSLGSRRLIENRPMNRQFWWGTLVKINDDDLPWEILGATLRQPHGSRGSLHKWEQHTQCPNSRRCLCRPWRIGLYFILKVEAFGVFCWMLKVRLAFPRHLKSTIIVS